LKLTILGTGTSQGVPVIGCTCPVCTSSDPRDDRQRSAALLSDGTVQVLIDAGPDFRRQMLRARVDRLDAILLTHEHNDHVIGLDDIRPLNFISGKPLAVHALERVTQEVKKRFEYVFADPIPGLPRIDLVPIDVGQQLQFGNLSVDVIGVQHGRLPILGFRFGNAAYLTDVKTLLPSELEKLRGLKHLVLNALHHTEHPTHLNLSEALALIDVLKPQHAWLTHMSHKMGKYEELAKSLPPGVSMAYDGLEIEL
jgi:phosphoribosyl 1,2-cyclic phosphate phosphodiesterase